MLAPVGPTPPLTPHLHSWLHPPDPRRRPCLARLRPTGSSRGVRGPGAAILPTLRRTGSGGSLWLLCRKAQRRAPIRLDRLRRVMARTGAWNARLGSLVTGLWKASWRCHARVLLRRRR